MEVDKMLSEEFQLDYSNQMFEPFGEFVFPERQGKGIHDGQKSISWVALLKCIAHFSGIRFGRKNKFEILGALHELREFAMPFPPSSVSFISRLLDFFESKGLVVCFDGINSMTLRQNKIPADTNYFVGRGSSLYMSKSGLFDVGFGDFFPNATNIVASQDSTRIYLEHLVIPDQVNSLSLCAGLSCVRKPIQIVDYIELPKSWHEKERELNFLNTIMGPNARIIYREE